MTEEVRQRLATFDAMQRRLIIEAQEKGEDLEQALSKIKEDTRAEHMNILKDINYPIPDLSPPTFSG